MRPEALLLDHFAALAAAPGGVAKLRELILQLAVQGKLVPQDPADEPASVLLERIAAEKRRLVREGVIGKAKPLPPVEGVPFEVPDCWKWAWIADVTYNFGQKVPDRDFTYIDVSSINKEKGRISDELTVMRPEGAPSRARKLVSKDTVIYSTVRPYLLNIAIIDQNYNPEPIVSTAFAVLHPHFGLSNRFLYYYLRSPQFTKFVESEMTGMAYPAISESKFFKGLIPLPPLPEQHRIVAKVDALMTLCDALEARQAEQRETHTKLGTAALAALSEAEAFEDAWALVAGNFDLIFDSRENVAALRQTVLQLAVQGRLVPQDPADEPALVLLERIAAEKRRLVREGVIGKAKPLPPVDEVPFEVPAGWRWVRFGEITYNRDSERIPLSRSERENRQGQYDYYGASGVIDHIDRYLFDKTLLLIGEDGANLLNRSTPIAFIAEGKYWVNNHAHVLDGVSSDFLRYVALFINAIDLHPYVTGTAQPKMNQTKMNSILVALPPINEQIRIIKKVDALMALCDALDSRIAEREEAGTKLIEAVVGSCASWPLLPPAGE